MKPDRLSFSLLLLHLIAVCAVHSINETKISVLISTPPELRFKDVEREVQRTFDSVVGEMGLSETARVTLQVQFVDAGQYDGEPNTLYITRDIVCGQLLNRSVAVLLLHYGRHMPISASSTAAYALGFYRVPTIGVGIQDAEFSRKTVYPTFLRTSPPYSNEARVFLQLLHELQYREVVVVHVKADVNALQFIAVFEKDRSDFKIHVQKYIELDLTSSLNTSVEEHFEEVTSNIIILFAKTEDAEVIIDSAPVLSTPGKVCMLSEQASNVRRLPTGCLSVRPRQNALSALRDAMVVMRHGVEFLADYEVDPPQQCANNALNTDWTNTVGNAFYKHLLSTTVFGDNKIEFNEKGDRINIAYDITNSIDGKLEVVGYMSGQNRMELDEWRIVWLGGLSKPLEITLPKHLRAVTVADYPFVYTVPTIDSAGCEKLGTVLVEGIDVSGPWFACPKRNNDSTTEMFCCSGYAIDLLANLALPEINGSIDTGFTFDLHLNDSYGAVLLGENGYVLNGMVGELDIDMADLAVGALTINPEREQYIDFSEPWLYHGIRILEKWKPRDSPMESFLQPLNSSLWSALFISVLFVGCAIFLLDLYSPFDRFFRVDKSRIDPDDPFLEPTEDDRLDFGEAMWFVWGVLLNSGVSEKTPRSCSGRALGIVWCGFCMIMVASYTANLAAFLVLDQPEKGLTGVTDPRLRNPAANFSFGTVLDTNTYQYFKRHVELSTMHRNMEAHNVRAAAHAIRALINETLDAFIWDSTRLEFEAARNCELRTRGTLFGRSAYGIGLQKNSPWTPHITNAILRLTESGKMEELYAKWIDSAKTKPCVQETHKSPARLGLTNMRDVFILVSGGIGVGIILSVLEVSHGRRKTAARKRRQLALRYAQKWRRLAKRHSHAITASCGHGSTDDNIASNIAPQITVHPYHKGRLVVGRHTASLQNSCRIQRKFPKTDLNFRTKPVRVFCSRCRNLVETRTYPTMGLFAYVASGVLIVLFLWPCAPIPCFLSCFADYIHTCPRCAHRIGRFRRLRKTQFFV